MFSEREKETQRERERETEREKERQRERKEHSGCANNVDEESRLCAGGQGTRTSQRVSVLVFGLSRSKGHLLSYRSSPFTRANAQGGTWETNSTQPQKTTRANEVQKVLVTPPQPTLPHTRNVPGLLSI